MKQLCGIFICLVAVLAMISGCSKEPGPLSNQSGVPEQLAQALLSIPPGATLESATLYIYVAGPSGQTVDVHRITAPWEETVVTWNNFGGAYTPGVEGSFVADAVDWRMVDVTALVAGWLDGSYDNYGLLLDQVLATYPRTFYLSRQADENQPYLEVCYSTGGPIECEMIAPIADAYINEYLPDHNTGLEPVLFTGWAADNELEKQTLIQFDLPVTPPLGALGDFVWYDNDQDGIQDVGEPGIAGVTVHLLNCAGDILATTTTDASGLYLFTDLPAGDYQVHFDLLPGFVFSPQDQGMDDAMDSDADPATGLADCTNLGPGEVDLTWDAGMYEELVYGECDGQVTELTVRYDGSIVDAHIVVTARRGDVVFDGIVQPGEQFTFVGVYHHGTLGPETYYYVNGVYNTNIHTSCSQPIGPGLTKGDFTVIEGYSRNGGLLPPL